MITVIGLVIAYAIALVAVRSVARGPFPSSLSDLVLIGAGIFHVFPEVIRLCIAVPPGMYREAVAESSLADWRIVTSVALIALALGVQVGSRVHPGVGIKVSVDAALASRRDRAYLWLLWAVSIPCGLAAISGAGVGQFGEDNYFLGGIVGMAFLPLVVSAAVVSALLRRAPIVALAGSILIASMVGSRSVVGWSFLAWVTSVRMFGVPVRVARLVVGASAVAAIIVAISVVRDSAGRWGADASLADRVSTLQRAAQSGGKAASSAELIYDQFVNRLDGNSYGALVIHAQHSAGRPPMGWGALIDTAAIVVPSFLWPSKLETETGTRNQEDASILHFGLPPVDYLPTWLGSVVGMLGRAQALLGALLLGVCLGAADRRPWHGVAWAPVAVSLSLALLYFEGGIEDLLVRLRACAFVALISGFLWILAGVASRRASRDARALGRHE
jgi:hypothetical protein